MNTALRDALTARLARYDSLVEVGVGRRPDVAAALAADGASVTVTDVVDVTALDGVEVPEGVRFVRDDVVAASDATDPGPLYAVDAIYALNLPAELHRPVRDVARATGADFLFTTLGYEEPDVAVRRETVGDVEIGRETVYVAV
ncbi:hypothetical protein SAMN04487949_0623 [Halogranum gelatinilyticum]|uniref:UPF0146 protein SAMN04487949_0623 n=1 Tax=Halogranum gelatinilyticum TaxID=660521 RepID=A0A1G9PZW3_9EURY|nr:UPF0146 family protein [Halogranum gelatinilyticum]SDM04348.1 hypothetical protein SAMN04487949_0623 [Halogranum gelatinilyticum]